MNLDDNYVNTIPESCGICGNSHSYSKCNIVEIKEYIQDTIIPSKARLTLPACLSLVTMADGSWCTIANTFIEKGTIFGPLQAQILLTMNPNTQLPLKLFNRNVEDMSEYYLDTCDENNCNWMIFVSTAQNREEQNLICFQDQSKIFYLANKNILEGEHLKLWYAPHYAKLMGASILPPLIEQETAEQYIDITEILKKQQNIVERDNWTCKFCGKLETDVTLFASHMIDHYTSRVAKKVCDICKESFSNKILLRKHQRVVHNAVFPSSKKPKPTIIVQENITNKNTVGDPLLNNLTLMATNDSFDNSNLVLPNLELNQFNVNLSNTIANQSTLLENDNLSLNVENFLLGNVKELDHFNFEIGESQEQFVCDICLKSFSKAINLKMHMKSHTGRFTCRHCLRIFSRQENLNSHVCKESKSIKSRCPICKRGFMLRKYMQRHLRAAHQKRFSCEQCGNSYYSSKEFQDHNCSLAANRETFMCLLCDKNFMNEKSYKKHSKVHLNKEIDTNDRSSYICEICAQEFTTNQGLKLHSFVHMKRQFECDSCDKKFFRSDVLKIHQETQHSDINKLACQICNKEFKTKRSLSIHTGLHTAVKSYSCDICLKPFYLASTLRKHKETMHLNKCNTCKKVFESESLLELHKKDHAIGYFECPLCNKFLKLRSSLRRHLKQFHSERNIDDVMLHIKSKEISFNESLRIEYNENFPEDDVIGNDDSGINNEINANLENCNLENIVKNFDDIMNDYDCNNTEYLLSEKCMSMEKTNTNDDRSLDLNDLEIDFHNNIAASAVPNTTENREVCLSMPDLSETDQEIMLGANAYMLEDGTIVEQKDQGNVLVYVLGKNGFT